MDVSGSLSLVQTVIEKLASPIWDQIEAILGLETQLDKLKDTMSAIEAVLLDAEEQEHHQQYRFTHVERNKLRRLKEALYRADDLFDEIATLGHLKKLRPCNSNKVCNEVCLFFSRSNQLRFAFNWSQEIENIVGMLEDIVKDHRYDFGLRHPVGLDAKQLRINARETHSFLSEEDGVIGREKDKQEVTEMLLNKTVDQDLFVVSIVGIGGLGKTTLARQVYNNEMVVKEFPLKMWVCVSIDFNVKAVVGQILAAANPEIKQDQLNLEQLQMNLRKELDRKKYLLVLDDVWNEDSRKWLELRNLLIGGGRVSRILVTTRSKKVADVVGSHWTHELEGLSDDESLDLFFKMALKPEEHPVKKELVDIGKEIVRKCANVPLAIRMVGSLLRDQDECRWENLKNTDLANIVQDDTNDIVPMLKISYNYLPFHLKSCFSYCAIFPKDYKIIKEDLICLWMAQGFIIPSNGESFEDAGDKYFQQLLERCFFQDVELAEGTTNEIVSCKMHDLIHDLAKEVAGTEILSCTYSTSCFNEKTRHVYIDGSTPKDLVGKLNNMQRMRTFLCIEDIDFSLRPFVRGVSKVKYLRVLRLNNCNRLLKLPSMIGDLVHLRYFDLSYNRYLFVLPSSITKLYNLQTLKLCECMYLGELPRELRKLVNLRHLDIYGCMSLTHMPPGMNTMISLQKLTMFVVSGSETSNAGWNWRSTGVGQLEDLDGFTNYSRTMQIIIKKGVTYNAVGRGMLFKSRNLWEIMYKWETEESNNAEELLQGLQPDSKLRKLELCDYPRVTLPTWMMNLNTCLPNLVQIAIRGCKRLEHIPMMSQLRHLKLLEFDGLNQVEYMESSSNIISGSEDGESIFFPSLKKLMLHNMPNLKRWWKSESESGKGETPQAPMLSHLYIWDCPNLTTFPFCPELQELLLRGFNEELGPIMRETTWQKEEGRYGRLREVTLDNAAYLNSLPIQSFHHLSLLEIRDDQKMERLNLEVGEVFRSGSLSSLSSFLIYNCNNLKSISGRGVWEHFTALETLKLDELSELELKVEDDVINNIEEGCVNDEGSDVEMPWRYLAPTLRYLRLSKLPKVVKLPYGIGCLSSLYSLEFWGCDNLESLTPSIGGLSSLQSLIIVQCPKLKTMPEEMRHLTSLTKLHIWECSPELMNECKSKNGANWSNIQHIPNIEPDF